MQSFRLFRGIICIKSEIQPSLRICLLQKYWMVTKYYPHRFLSSQVCRGGSHFNCWTVIKFWKYFQTSPTSGETGKLSSSQEGQAKYNCFSPWRWPSSAGDPQNKWQWWHPEYNESWAPRAVCHGKHSRASAKTFWAHIRYKDWGAPPSAYNSLDFSPGNAKPRPSEPTSPSDSWSSLTIHRRRKHCHPSKVSKTQDLFLQDFPKSRNK